MNHDDGTYRGRLVQKWRVRTSASTATLIESRSRYWWSFAAFAGVGISLLWMVWTVTDRADRHGVGMAVMFIAVPTFLAGAAAVSWHMRVVLDPLDSAVYVKRMLLGVPIRTRRLDLHGALLVGGDVVVEEKVIEESRGDTARGCAMLLLGPIGHVIHFVGYLTRKPRIDIRYIPAIYYCVGTYIEPLMACDNPASALAALEKLHRAMPEHVDGEYHHDLYLTLATHDLSALPDTVDV